MRFLFKKWVVFALIMLAAVCVLFALKNKPPVAPAETPVDNSKNVAVYKVIGTSVDGRKIESYTYGSGDTHLAFVGGMHGGYEWNSVLLAYQFIDYLNDTYEAIPDNVTVTVIPNVNPDGVYAVTGKEGRFVAADVSTDKQILATGRFNANDVDLNRNFDCKWQPKGTWQSKATSAGTAAFSEPETSAIKNFVLEDKPTAVVFWHSQSNAVYASECKNGILPETLNIMNAYSKVSGYPAVSSFNAYPVTGDAEGWLASINIPAITVELKTHETVEWDRNLAGIKALFEYYGPKKFVKLYFYDSKLDQGNGGAECSRSGVVAVDRVLPKTDTLLQDSVKLLLRGELSDSEKAEGITTEFPLAGLSLKSTAVKDGVATLTFNDPQNKTSGGSCRAGVLWFQIEATAKQFSNVKTVRFMPEDLFQP